ncbi:MAG: tetratricopeptide repeat protein, partial [Methanoregula sp.]|nr:tetratricopeptide repeat protein [Methanoregula sp.]
SLEAYEQAEPLYLEALRITKKVMGADHPDYVESLNSLAGLYYSMEAYEKAEPLYVEGLEITKRAAGDENP